MITKEVVVSKFEIDTEALTVSIKLDTVIKEDGRELARSSHRRGFVPGDIEDIRTYTGKDVSAELIYLESLWSPEAVAAYLVAVEESTP